MRRKHIVLLSLIVSYILINSAQATDWLRWRGPKGNGISPETNWNPSALEGGADKLWQINVGVGWSAVAIQDERLYTMGNRDDRDIVYCLNVDTGEEIWRYEYACPAGDYAGPRSTPVIDGSNVYSISRNGLLFCLDAQSGTVRWRKSITREFGARSPGWGFAASPRIEGDKLLLNACTHGVALDKITGETLWVSPPGVCGYAVPVVYEMSGRKRTVIFGEKAIYGVDMETGEKLWSHTWITEYDVNAADPIVVGDKVFVSSGYNKGCILIDISDNNPKRIWQNMNMRNHFSSCVYIDGYIYGSDGNCGRRRSALNCIDMKTGDPVWSQTIGMNSLIASNGKLITLNERGTLFIANATPNGYQEVSSATVLPASRSVVCWTAPVLCGGRIYCRNGSGDLVCIDVRDDVVYNL
jgi:outer membrane protein assembly factor BamB